MLSAVHNGLFTPLLAVRRHISLTAKGKRVKVFHHRSSGNRSFSAQTFLLSVFCHLYLQTLQTDGFSAIMLLDFLSWYYLWPLVAPESSNVLWYVTGLSNLYAFSCPSGTTEQLHHAAAALQLCATLLLVQSISTFPPSEALPDWAWVCLRRRTKLSRDCQMPRLASLSLLCCV